MDVHRRPARADAQLYQPAKGRRPRLPTAQPFGLAPLRVRDPPARTRQVALLHPLQEPERIELDSPGIS
ncbi:hypothetical protein [Streptomyces sp. NPDC057696]|uniref:hypothetical protein n=1 Tax=Streptomyces sp. NPDC057696 TaxID=3346218 RepID=UPI0036812296